MVAGGILGQGDLFFLIGVFIASVNGIRSNLVWRKKQTILGERQDQKL